VKTTLKDCHLRWFLGIFFTLLNISFLPHYLVLLSLRLPPLVNVNSLFTIIILVGLSLTTLGQHDLENHSSCDANIDVAKKLLVFVVVLFSFFLLSSLVAQGMKLALNLLNSKDVDKAFRAHINLRALRLGVVGSAIGFVMGCLFLVLSMALN